MSGIVRSFEVKVEKEALVGNISRYLDDKLRVLQEDGWEILSVDQFKYKGWDYPRSFDAVGYTIIAKHK